MDKNEAGVGKLRTEKRHYCWGCVYGRNRCYNKMYSERPLSLPLPSRKHILFYSLFYPITLEDRRGTTDEFATIPFHLVLFSAALVELAKSIPVHSLILSSHLFFCLPLILFPFTVPCRIVFARPEDLETWPNHLSFRFLDQSQEFVIFSNGCLDLFANLLIDNMSLYEMFNSLW